MGSRSGGGTADKLREAELQAEAEVLSDCEEPEEVRARAGDVGIFLCIRVVLHHGLGTIAVFFSWEY